jgi:hypothetical protein
MIQYFIATRKRNAPQILPRLSSGRGSLLRLATYLYAVASWHRKIAFMFLKAFPPPKVRPHRLTSKVQASVDCSSRGLLPADFPATLARFVGSQSSTNEPTNSLTLMLSSVK